MMHAILHNGAHMGPYLDSLPRLDERAFPHPLFFKPEVIALFRGCDSMYGNIMERQYDVSTTVFSVSFLALNNLIVIRLFVAK